MDINRISAFVEAVRYHEDKKLHLEFMQIVPLDGFVDLVPAEVEVLLLRREVITIYHIAQRSQFRILS